MATERQVQELIARCVGIAVIYHNCGRTPKAEALMAAEVQALAGAVGGWGLSGEVTEEVFLRPVEGELIARYGPESGGRLNAEVVAAFGGRAVPVPRPAAT